MRKRAAISAVVLAVVPTLTPTSSAVAGAAVPDRLLSLDITVPSGSVSLGHGGPGSVLEGALGQVTVADTRLGITSNWTASVHATDFTGGGRTISVSNVAYWSGPAVVAQGGGIFTPGQATRAARMTLGGSGAPVTAFSHSGGLLTGSTGAWNPQLVVSVPFSTQNGDYRGTVTHSVV
ncbi:hypothetical protein [Rhizohabitans arisaemae]|uniref:hypothetical protein n=1 Tax=Rhizohabitans arisaemae TaxID=2720610 RepID=UPI0024B20B34|nr:hypothetical protein [Rhizohabitans arisaemae]